MLIQYWPEYQPDDQEKVAVTSRDDDSGSWIVSVGCAGVTVAMASAMLAAGMVHAASSMQPYMDDVLASPVTVAFEEYTQTREISVTYGNRTTLFVGSQELASPVTVRIDNSDPGQPELTPEPTLYIIGPGNWGAGTDDIGRSTPVDETWDNPVPHREWEIRRENPWFIPDDPTSPRVSSDQCEQLPDVGPSIDLLVNIIAPWAWTAGSDEMPRFVSLSRDEDYWIDPSPVTTTLWNIGPLRPYTLHPEDPVSGIVTVILKEDEFWKNPLSPFPYWNKWPVPAHQQDDPSGLFVLPVLPCVVSPALLGTVTTSVEFTPTAFAQVVFTDVCGDPLP